MLHKDVRKWYNAARAHDYDGDVHWRTCPCNTYQEAYDGARRMTQSINAKTASFGRKVMEFIKWELPVNTYPFVEWSALQRMCAEGLDIAQDEVARET